MPNTNTFLFLPCVLLFLTKTQCDPGFYSDQASQTSCKRCVIGKHNEHSNSNDALACQDCVAGKYGDLEGQAQCKDCIAGLFGTAVGASVEATTCTACVGGQYSGTAGQTSCLVCEPNSYLSAELNPRNNPRTSCLPCVGTAAGAITCDGCAAGQYGISGSSVTPW